MNVKVWINEKEYEEKKYNRIFVTSDMYNHYEYFCQMRDSLNWGKDDLVIILGNIVGRSRKSGVNPLGILSEVRFNENRTYDVIMLKGHQEMELALAMKKYCSDGKDAYQYNKSLELLTKELDKTEILGYANWLANLPCGIKIEIAGYKKLIRFAHASTADLTSEYECLIGTDAQYYEASEYGSFTRRSITNFCRYRSCIEYKMKTSESDSNCNVFKSWNDNYVSTDDEKFITRYGFGSLELVENNQIKEHYFSIANDTELIE